MMGTKKGLAHAKPLAGMVLTCCWSAAGMFQATQVVHDGGDGGAVIRRQGEGLGVRRFCLGEARSEFAHHAEVVEQRRQASIAAGQSDPGEPNGDEVGSMGPPVVTPSASSDPEPVEATGQVMEKRQAQS